MTRRLGLNGGVGDWFGEGPPARVGEDVDDGRCLADERRAADVQGEPESRAQVLRCRGQGTSPACSRPAALVMPWPGIGKYVSTGVPDDSASRQVKPPAFWTTHWHASITSARSWRHARAAMPARWRRRARPAFVPQATTGDITPVPAMSRAAWARSPMPSEPPVTSARGPITPMPARGSPAGGVTGGRPRGDDRRDGDGSAAPVPSLSCRDLMDRQVEVRPAVDPIEWTEASVR